MCACAFVQVCVCVQMQDGAKAYSCMRESAQNEGMRHTTDQHCRGVSPDHGHPPGKSLPVVPAASTQGPPWWSRTLHSHHAASCGWPRHTSGWRLPRIWTYKTLGG